MKAIVAEIDKKQMIVITDKGDFIKVKRQLSLGIGDEIELKPQNINLTYRRLASIAACFLACIFLSTGVYAYYTPYSYVSVDINPSIALSLNRFERVIAVNPLNEDAVNLIKNTKGLKNQDIDDALSAIIKSASETGYIDEKTENQVMVVVSAKNSKQEEKLAEMVTIAANNELSKVNNNFGVMVEKASVKSYKEALSNKQSPGKEILADKLREVSPEIKDEEVRNMSVREVVHLIKEGKKAIMTTEKDNDKEDKDDKEEQFATNKDRDKKEDKEADSKAEKYNKGSDRHRPAAAVNKDNASTSDREKDNEDYRNKDREQENADKDKKDNKEIEDKGKHNNGADGQINNDDAKDKDNSDERDGKDKENKDGKKGD